MRLISTTALSLLTVVALAQTNPAPFNLANGNFTFNAWPAASAAGTYPASMVFHFTNDATANGYDITADGTGDFNCA